MKADQSQRSGSVMINYHDLNQINQALIQQAHEEGGQASSPPAQLKAAEARSGNNSKVR